MNETAAYVFGIGFWVFAAVVVAVVFWARIRKYQMRNETILKMLEQGKTLDPETLDKLLSPPGILSPPKIAAPVGPPSDPRAGYRTAGFIDFLIGFATVFYALANSGGVSYPLLALGILPILLAFVVWSAGDREFREGTLPALKGERDPREAHQGAFFVFFMIGYGTIFAGIVRDSGISYPIIGLGVLVILMACAILHSGQKEYEGRLASPSAGRE